MSHSNLSKRKKRNFRVVLFVGNNSVSVQANMVALLFMTYKDVTLGIDQQQE